MKRQAAIILIGLVTAISFTYAGSQFQFNKCVFHSLDYDGEEVHDQNLGPHYIICGDEVGGETECSSYVGQIKLHKKSLKPFDTRKFSTVLVDTVRAFSDEKETTLIFSYPNNKALYFSKHFTPKKGSLGHQLCSGAKLK